jgi:hypothetical protein
MVTVLAFFEHPFFFGPTTAETDFTFGTWTLGQPAPGHLLATHPTLLRNNKILVVGGSSYNCCFAWGKEEARLYDIATGTWSQKLPSPAPYGPDKDAFCSGHAHDDTGAVIFQGGLHSYVHNGFGILDSARYNVASGAFTPIGGARAHWYPTLVAGERHMFNFPGLSTELGQNPDGKDVALPGSPEHIHKLAYGTSTWISTGVTRLQKSTYPRVVLLPNGKFFIASPDVWHRKNHLYDPKTNDFTLAGDDVVPESAIFGQPPQTGFQETHAAESWKGTGVLLPLVPEGQDYPNPRFALINGIQAWVKEPQAVSPTWHPLGVRPPEMNGARRHYANATLLPTGQVFVSGGVLPPQEHDMDAVLNAEVYDPEGDAWVRTTAATVPRNYHGVAVLLPDGRVWTASGSQDHDGSECHAVPQCAGPERTEERVEIFTPWYVNRTDRPRITSAPQTMISDGREYTIDIGDAAGGQIERVVLMRPGSPTHSFDANQRLVQLDIVTATASSVTVRSPYRPAAAPPGDYMLFALRRVALTGFRRWVPSVAAWTRVANSIRTDEGAPIWRYVGPPCSGTSCPGWQRLDNNHKTVGVFASSMQHVHYLYQLHNDGWIWQFSGVPCTDDYCPGWRRLDNNHKTVMLAAAGNLLYQMHNDGWIWRHTGTPCNGDSCTGWERVDNNAKTVAIAASGNALYQLHNDGWIWRSTGVACNGDACLGWQRLDNNHKTIAIAATGDRLFQLHYDGWIWEFTGTACDGDKCPGWRRLDNNRKTVAIAAGGNQLYQLHNDGWIWRYIGTPCNGDQCPGWERLDNNSRTAAIIATAGASFQRHHDGRIWRYTGTPCKGDACAGWQELDNNARTGMIAVGDSPMMAAGNQLFQLHTDPLVQLHNDGWIWRYTGTECDKTYCPGWQRLDNNANTAEIAAAGSQVYQRHKDGTIWRSTGVPCQGDNCPGWQMIDNNPASAAIAAGGTQLYQRHTDGQIWRYVGRPCEATKCPGWQQLDRNPATIAIAATATTLFQLHKDGKIWRYTGAPCTAAACPGWQLVDANPSTTAIATAANQLFQRHKSGAIWRYTGTPCTGATPVCQGWQQLDNNPATASIVAGGNQLYQRHTNGQIWRHTGLPCNGTTCTGWERLDNNPATQEIVAASGHLYQRHSNGRIWRYVGPACTGDSCPGWRELDNNPKTVRIAAGGFQ